MAPNLEIDLVQRSPSRGLPPSRCDCEEEEAASFLSEWFDRSSFFTEGSAEDGGSGGEDIPGRTGRVVGRGSSSDDGSEGSEMRDFGISIGQIVGDDDLEVYEDRDRFNASTSTNNLTYYLPSSPREPKVSKGNSEIEIISKGRGGPRSPDEDNEGGPRKALIASQLDGDENSNSNKLGPKPQVVTLLPWRDRWGMLGKYTGQIDRSMRPHGYGALVYEDGSAVTSVWEDGVPIESRLPGEDRKKKKKQKKQRRSSRSNSGSSSSGSETRIANGTIKKHQHRSSGMDDIDGSRENSAGADNSRDKRKPRKQRQRSKLHSIGDAGQNATDQSGRRRRRSSSTAAAVIMPNRTYLPHLSLGDAGAPRDMMPESSEPIVAGLLDSRLKMHDFAFVLRSDGRWTYAIVSEKCEDAIAFVVDGDGRMKVLARKHWAHLIRLVRSG